MPLKINGLTTGSVTLAAPATGTDVTLTLPSSTLDLGTELSGKLDSALTQNTQTGVGASAYTFVLADADRLTVASASTSATYTVPPQSSVVWGNNDVIRVVSIGAGTITFAGGSGVTVTNTATTLAQYQSAALIRTGSNAWTVIPFGSSGGITLLKSSDVTATTGSPTISTSGTDTIYAFTGSGTITLSKTGYANILVLGGGGGSTRHVGNGAGDAGLLVYGFHQLSSGSNTVTVGAGGVGDSPSGSPGGSNGNDSVLGSITGRRGTFVNSTPNGANISLSIDGTAKTYAIGAQDPAVANRGHGGVASASNNGNGSSGYVVVRVTT